MKPILILPPETMSAEDIKILNDNGICTVTAKEPALVKFLDPIPAIGSRTEIEQAAIDLSRKLFDKETYSKWEESTGRWVRGSLARDDIARLYLHFLIKGTPLDPEPSEEEKQRVIFANAKSEETRRLAREEAKAEKQKQKEVAAKAAKTDKK